MKKLLNLFLAVLLMATLLAGCNQPGEDTSGASVGDGTETSMDGAVTPEGKDVVITMFVSKVEIADQLEAMAKEYSDQTNGVTVEVWGTTGDGYFDQLQSKLSAGASQSPTIFSVNPGEEAILLKNYLVELSDESYVQYVAQNMEVKVDGKTVGIPFGLEGFGLVYNESLVSANEITNFDSFESTLQKLKGEGLNPFSLSQEDYFLIAHILNVPFAMQENPEEFIQAVNGGTQTLSGNAIFEEWAKFMEAIRATCANPMEVTYDKQTGDFATGKNAIIHQGNWAWGMFADYDLGFDISMMPLPVNGNDKISIGVASAWCISSIATEEEQAAAKDLFTWMFESTGGHRYIVDEFKFVPAMTNINAPDLDPLSKAVNAYSNEGKSLIWTFNYWPAGIVGSDLAPATQKFFMDENMTGAQFLQELDAAWANATQ